MVENLGLRGTFIPIEFLGMGLHGLFFIMIAYGKQLRQMTAPAYWKLEEHGFHVH